MVGMKSRNGFRLGMIRVQVGDEKGSGWDVKGSGWDVKGSGWR